MRFKKIKKVLIFFCLFISVSALYGSICMFIDPTGKLLGMENSLHYFKVLPFSKFLFQNYIFSGISLLIVNGISNLIAAYLIWKNKKIGIILEMTFGFTLMLWITIQFIILPMNFMSITYFILGIIQTIIGYTTYVFFKQEQFQFNENNYQNINKNKDNIVVYFSRMDYTKKIAYEKANELGAAIVEIKTPIKVSGTSGFWWCGRYGMHKWSMKINNLNVNLKEYKNVIIVSPIWVFSICAPIREFCYKYYKEINQVEYIFTHFMSAKFKTVADETDKILKNKRKSYTSICTRIGKVRKIYYLK